MANRTAIGPLAATIRFTGERWADETAAGQVGDRTVVAQAVGRAALAGQTPSGGTAGMAATAWPVLRRVTALLAAPPHPCRRDNDTKPDRGACRDSSNSRPRCRCCTSWVAAGGWPCGALCRQWSVGACLCGARCYQRAPGPGADSHRAALAIAGPSLL
jgi:hypothetical protein